MGDDKYLILYSSDRITEYSDDLTLIRSEHTIKSEQLYYKVGTWNSTNNQLSFVDQGAYDYGKNPDFAFDEKREYFLEVHQSSSLNHLWYTVSKFVNGSNKPRFNKLNHDNYSKNGKNPTVSLISSTDDQSIFLDVHISDMNFLKYQVFSLQGD